LKWIGTNAEKTFQIILEARSHFHHPPSMELTSPCHEMMEIEKWVKLDRFDYHLRLAGSKHE
jgi:hypothetical protein